ncbi:DEAD/DEAH box helicase [bacterium]|nr:DEAD/DEAH box helicase [bacterium]
MTYDIADIDRAFGPRAVDSALHLLDSGQIEVSVEHTEPDDLRGLVRENDQVSEVVARVVPAAFDRPRLDASCNCSQPGCVHVPAVLLQAIATRSPEPSRSQIVLYLLDQEVVRGSHPGVLPHLTVQRVKVRVLEAGNYSDPVRCRHTGRAPIPKYMTAVDQRLFLVIDAAMPIHGRRTSSQRAILPEDVPELLERLVATGRCHWRDPNSPALHRGESRTGKLEWVLRNDGSQQLQIIVDRPGNPIALQSDPFRYVDPESATAGPLDVGHPTRRVNRLLRSPALVPQAAEWARLALEQRSEFDGFPRPEKVTVEEAVLTVKPVPHLFFHLDGDPESSKSEPLARLTFAYNDAVVFAGTPGSTVQSMVGNKLHSIRRDRMVEFNARQELERLGLEPVLDNLSKKRRDDAHRGEFMVAQDKSDVDGTDSAAHMFSISEFGVPSLREAGWVVEFAEDYPFHVVDAKYDWYADVEPSSKTEWFDLELGIDIEGQRENLLPILIRMIRDPRFQLSADELRSMDEDAKILVPLGKRGSIALSGQRVRAILGTLLELYGDESLGQGERLSMSNWNAPRLAELEDALGAGVVRWAGGERLRDLGRKLQHFEGVQEVAVPSGFQGTLRAYQQDGLNWLQFLREYGLSGILADDMGLGKTVQILAHLLVEKQSGRMDGPSVVVAPTSAMTNWFREAQRFAPELRVLNLQGAERKRHFPDIADYDLVLTTYPLLSRDAEVLSAQSWYFAVFDEAQFIKNARTRSARNAAGLQATHRLCVTGTPMENHLGELWSLFNILMPGLLGSRRQFGKLFRTPIEKYDDHDRRDRLISRIRPFMLRRNKDEVELDLPPKTEVVQLIELQRGQRDLYESIRLALHDKVREAVANNGMARSTIVILDALLKLRQVCCDPRLLKIESARHVQERAKLDALLEMLEELLDEGRRILLFSQFTSMLALIEPELEARGWPWVKLTGQTTDRDTPIRQFQNGEVPLFLISLKAGGTALNLTAADTVIHYDPWWNPAVEAQATDRAHRIGQDKPIFVYKLIATNSVEEKMLVMQERKRSLAQGIYGAGARQGAGFTSEDLDFLFQPLQ